MELSSGQCAIRPQCGFVAYKGRDKLQQLHILSELPRNGPETSYDTTIPQAAPRNVNDFMDSRSSDAGDPTSQRTLVAIQWLNFGSNRAPLCMAATAALLDRLLRVYTAQELDESQNDIGALDINNIDLSIIPQLGRGLLRRWCLRSSLSIPIIEARHAVIECFNLPDNVAVSNALTSNLRALCQVPKAMALPRTRGKLPEWRAIANFSYRIGMLKDGVCELIDQEGVGVINQFLAALEGVNSEDIGVLINTIVGNPATSVVQCRTLFW
ncbi:MutS protein msh5 [Ceratobasidium sp. UAMH 11750]|nr:MutS protein msh5 [Ceratobasidium sp. UAMH 11750]